MKKIYCNYGDLHDEQALATFLCSQDAVEGGNYKPQVWNSAAGAMPQPERGAVKTAATCKSKWGRVHQLLTLLADIGLLNAPSQMKKHFQDVVLPLTRLSGIQWTPESRIGINDMTPQSVRDIWNDYTKVCGSNYPLLTIVMVLFYRPISQQRITQTAVHSITILSSWCLVMQRGAFHGQLVMQSQATTSSAPSFQTVTVNGKQDQDKQDDYAEDSSPAGMALDSGDMDQESLREGGGTGGGIQDKSVVAGGSHTDDNDESDSGLGNDIPPTSPPSTPSVTAKCRFSAVDSGADSSTEALP